MHYGLLNQEPVSIVLGSHPKPNEPKKDGSLRESKDVLVYIPILQTIQKLLENDSVLAQVSITPIHHPI